MMASKATTSKAGQEEIVTVRIPSYLVTRLRDLASRSDRTLSAEIRVAVRRYVEDTA